MRLNRVPSASKPMIGIVSVTLVAIGWIVYQSPAASHQAAPVTRIVRVDQTMPRKGHTEIPKSPQPSPTPKHITVTSVSVLPKVPAAPGATPQSASCASFQWQQDAQAAYLADLSDPEGLDGPPGPDNGDGLACGELPSDPSRAKSTPVDPYVWAAPNPPTKAQVLAPQQKYLGVAADGLPGDSALFDSEDTELGQAPSTVEWFQTFSDAYPFAKVRTAWQRGALPVITWMSEPANSAQSPDLSAYSLSSIANGSQDAYIRTWAGSIAAQAMPVVIRFDHESNGNWYPWSVGWPPTGAASNQGISGNTPAEYVAAWRHVWSIFNSLGANAYAIWAYVPSRIDTLAGYDGMTQSQLIAAAYPGDAYTDWVGVDGYQYNPAESTTYSDTFAATFAALGSFSSKPIIVAEMGSAEQSGGVKARWIQQTLAGLSANPRVISAIYFDNDVTGVHYIDGKPIRTDWRIDSDPAAASAFQAGAASGNFSQGIYPPYLSGD
jgi:hypothetical protein